MNSRQLDEERIFHTARKIADREAQAEYLDQICAGDQSLRDRVEALLGVHQNERNFLKSNGAVEPTVGHSPVTEAPGQQIGRYKLLQQIGEGGFGVVYMANQQRPLRRKVALKIIKPGMDTHAVVARFEAERQTLAMMDHPNIARVLDGGATASGRPYFVMELVNGVPITEYCDKNQLSTEERLMLFTTICQAVQHAHQKGIIHRDLKPSNVLVTLADGKPIVKVIDFGVAKATNQQLTEKTLFTAFGQMVGTPQYMSPEQAEMNCLGVDTRSDVYSLGVLLYELLTGTTPLEAERLRTAGYAEIQRLIQEEETPKPSTRLSTSGEELTALAKHRNVAPEKLKSLVQGDLDWIVMKALEKDRNRRYESPSAFARDVANYLDSEPVEARPPTLGYRTAKFLKRNRLAVTVAGLVFTLLAFGLGGTMWEWRSAVNEERRAVNEAMRANRLLKELDDSLFDQGFNRLFAGKPAHAKSIADTLNEHGQPMLASKLDASILIFDAPNLKEATRILEQARTLDPNDPGLVAMLMFTYSALGDHARFYQTYPRLEKLLARSDPKTSVDCVFIARTMGLDSTNALRFAERAVEIQPSPVPLLTRGLLRAKFAMHNSDIEAARDAILDIDAARRLLGNMVAVRIDGLSAHLLAANALRSSGKNEESQTLLDHAQSLVEQFPNSSLLLPWEKFFLLEYYHEQKRPTEVVKLLSNTNHADYGDFVSYYMGIIQFEMTGEIPKDRSSRTDHADRPYSQAGMAIISSLTGQHDQTQNRSIATHLIRDYDIPELIALGLDVLIFSGATMEEVESHAKEALHRLRAKRQKLDSWSNRYAERVLTIYAGEYDDTLLPSMAKPPSAKLWSSYGHWAFAMRLLAEDDLKGAHAQLEKVIQQRVIYLANYLWARALLERWDNVAAARAANR